MKKTKGISLPIEVIVILMIAVIVLLAIVIFFTTTMNVQDKNMKSQQRWQSACGVLKMRGCNTDAVGQIEIDSVKMFNPDNPSDKNTLCYLISGTTDATICCQACCGTDSSCGSSASSSGGGGLGGDDNSDILPTEDN